MSFTRYPSLEGKTVIVTGGASGIGECHVRAFAAQGARVAFLDLQREAGQALSAAVEGRPLFVQCDLTDIAALRAALAEVHAKLGNASVLVNNAANDKRQQLAEVTPEEFDWTISVNLRHVYFACQTVIPQMQALGGGAIVNMSSVAWLAGGPDMQAYSAAKAAIVGLTNSLGTQFGKDRIRVNAIAPGMIITERQRQLWFQDESKITQGLTRQSIPEVIAPEEVAKLALFLAADDSRMITKQCLVISAGSR